MSAQHFLWGAHESNPLTHTEGFAERRPAESLCPARHACAARLARVDTAGPEEVR